MYGSVASADIYFSYRMKHEVWDDAATANKTRALETATTHIDRLNFLGSKTEDTQTNEFPRDISDDETPEVIEYATYEIAYALLEGRDPEMELETLGLESASLNPAKVVFNKNSVPLHLANGIVSAMAWSYLKPYLRSPSNMRVYRVN